MRGIVAFGSVHVALVVAAMAAAQESQSQSQSQPASRPASRLAPEHAEPDESAGYKLDPGPHAVAVVDAFELYDRNRDKKLELLIRYPKSAAAATSAPASASSRPTSQPDSPGLPLVIFSHGAGGSCDAFGELSRHLASHGYVVIHPTHSDSIRQRWREGEDMRGLRNDPTRIRRNVNPLDRMADVRLILDRLDKIEAEVAGLHDASGAGRIDRDQIAIAGHSAGAYTAQMAIGVRMRGVRAAGGRGGLRSVGDPRIKAAILISGQGLTNPAFTEESWKELARPMLVFAGSLDTTIISNETPESRRHPFEYARPGDKYLIWIEGATHGSYQGRDLPRLLNESPTTDVHVITNAVRSGVLAFLDAYLRDDDAARRYLSGDGITKLTGGVATLSRK